MATSLEAPAELPYLPDKVVTCILQHLPLRERLTRCALVCQAWAALAAAVPADLELRLDSSKKLMQLQDWLNEHGDAVVHLALSRVYHDVPTLQLPVRRLTQLRSLDISRIEVKLPKNHQIQQQQAVEGMSSCSQRQQQRQRRSGSVGSPTDVLPQLQDMLLSSCLLSIDLLSQLLSTTSLTKLHWDSVRSLNDRSVPPMLSMLWQGLQLLPKLSELQMFDVDALGVDALTIADSTPISNLKSLQDLHVVLQHRSSAAAIAAVVPTGLTSLKIAVNYPMDEIESDAETLTEVGLGRLSSLKSFCGEGLRMGPSTLACLKGLQELRLSDIVSAGTSEEQGARELLAALQHLTQLKHLQLNRCHLQTLKPQPDGQLEQQEFDSLSCLSALTASTQLTALVLKQLNDVPVLQAGFGHIFPPERVLLHLKVPSLTSYGFRHCVEAAQVARIAASCPALQELTLQGVTPRGFHVSCLQQLPQGVRRVEGLGWTRPSPAGLGIVPAEWKQRLLAACDALRCHTTGLPVAAAPGGEESGGS